MKNKEGIADEDVDEMIKGNKSIEKILIHELINRIQNNEEYGWRTNIWRDLL